MILEKMYRANLLKVAVAVCTLWNSKKALRLNDRARDWCYTGYAHELTEHDKQMIQQTSQDFDDYMASLRRKNTEGNDGKETD